MNKALTNRKRILYNGKNTNLVHSNGGEYIMLNLFAMQGRLTHDPELKESESGTKYARFSLAVQRSFSRDKETDFFNVVSFGKTAEFIQKYLTKGKQVVIVGSLRTSEYEKSGVTTKRIELVAKEVNFASSKAESERELSNDNDIESELPF